MILEHDNGTLLFPNQIETKLQLDTSEIDENTSFVRLNQILI